jgi:hypothetical protein
MWFLLVWSVGSKQRVRGGSKPSGDSKHQLLALQQVLLVS